mgnify:CR=1 FL=1
MLLPLLLNNKDVKNMQKIKTYIINYNRLIWPLNMANYLAQLSDLEVIFIDNASTYEPLLEWYNRQTTFEVIKMTQNYGHNVFWSQNLINQVSDYYIVTDPDLDLSDIPLNFLDILKEGLSKYPSRCKCGFGLEIYDFPKDKTPYQDYIVNIEKNYWSGDFDGLYYYNSAIDTTFALYHKSRYNNLTAVRTSRPYVARHLPWYFTKDNLTDEDINYIKTAAGSCSAKRQMELFL